MSIVDLTAQAGQPGTLLPLAELPQTPYATLSPADISKLSTMQPMEVELISEYWTPQQYNEKKNVLFDSIRTSQMIDQQSGEVMDLECAFFWEEHQGSSRMIRNGSKRLVGTLQSFKLRQYTPLLVTYKGKKKNSTNSFSADDWSIKPLGPSHV